MFLALAGSAAAQGKSGTKDAKAVETEAPPEAAEKPAPYDDGLLRLSEILGAMHYLRNLCKDDSEPEWRDAMQKLIETETAGEEKRQERFTASFNRGYRSFASVYTSCTAAAVVAEERYRNEGATLAVEITSRFGN
ncbi:MAG: TIGR02301 family protein [Allorhizobium sp.]